MQLICAVDINGIIGDSKTNSIPWHLPTDLKHFKEITTGKTIVMGSRTYNSLGRNLPNRRSVVISQGGTALNAEPHAIYSSLDLAMQIEKEIIVIGGERLFAEAIKRAQLLHMTVVDFDSGGDVKFPIVGSDLKNNQVIGDFQVSERSDWREENNLRFQFITLNRV